MSADAMAGVASLLVDPALPLPPDRRPRRRALLWAALVALLLVAQSLLVLLTVRYEASRSQDQIDDLAAEAAVQLRRDVLRSMQRVQALTWSGPELVPWQDGATELMRSQRELMRVERRDPRLSVSTAVDSPASPRLFAQLSRRDLSVDTEIACLAARRQTTPQFSRSYFVPLAGGLGLEVVDLCIPMQHNGRDDGFLVATYSLPALLEGLLTPQQSRGVELSIIDGDGSRLARAGGPRGAGVFRTERIVDLPGVSLRLRADSGAGAPSLIPNVTLALVLGLSIALFGVVLLLARDVRRRAEAERALDEALAFRKAMEDSLITGLRARDMEGQISYVNPAFCAMVGFSAEELQQQVPPNPPPYWPPEHAEQYQQRHLARRSATLPAVREGLETVFMRKNGERFPVVIYEAPLLDREGRQTGWMSTVLDISAQRSVEELSRQQQERLQASARLATVGEMASLLSHELNQPLAAIASYASGSLNLMAAPQDGNDGDAETRAMLRQALERIGEQAERAGRVIKSVHAFVRRREQAREAISAQALIDAVLPLVRLQARKSGTRIEIDLPPRQTPRVVCDRTMLEQVLLNLTRNAIQAMENDTPLPERVMTLRVRQTHPKWVTFSVVDAGPGISADVAARLFTPFFTTRAEGMGLGLSLCRTVIEQHGGALDFGPVAGVGTGTEFRFTLPSARHAESSLAPYGRPEPAGPPEGERSGPAEPDPEQAP